MRKHNFEGKIRTNKQAWLACNYEWGIDEFVIVQTSQGRICLCDVIENWSPNSFMPDIEYEPVKYTSLPSI